MFNKMLVITLGVTGLSSVLLFLYFRNRLSEVEKKVDTMFNLIQSYETVEKQPQFTMEENPPPEYYQQQMMGQQFEEQQQQQQDFNPNNELVTVSDKGDDSSESESEDDSDSDEDYSSDEEVTKPLVVNNSNDTVQLKEEDVSTNLKEISLEKQITTQEQVEEVEEEVTKNINLNSEDHDLSSMKVTDLKNLCKEKGLSGYRNLRKNDLIELLSA
tara:strand:- start:3220 stop:3864 length:645 start_codon:yes stop_codon:yes gene_type:complete